LPGSTNSQTARGGILKVKIATLRLIRISFLACLTGGASLAQDNFLPAEQAYRYEVERAGSTLNIHWHIARGYYLYKSRMSLGTTTRGVELGTATYPKGQIHKDEFFGAQEIYRDSITVTAPFTVNSAQAKAIVLQLKWQGCADAGLCYPPTTWETTVPLPR
jgi:thioredoxin:protein disulfide reductase